jgi:DNA-binding FadR family transcriptional regulator
VLLPIRKKSLALAVFDQLADRIVGGGFEPGQPLPPERLLCQQLGVSRTAVREALARLEQLGLVATRQGGETTARDFRSTAGLDLLPRIALDGEGRPRPDIMHGVVEMRAAVAPDIARLCALRADATVDAELEAIVAEMEPCADDLPRLQELSMRFWSTLTMGSRNVGYQLALNSLRDVYLRLRERIGAAMADELRNVEGYRAIAAAVRARNAAAAETAARRHIQRGLGPVLALFGA